MQETAISLTDAGKEVARKTLKKRAVRGGLATIISQAVLTFLRLVWTMVMGRLLVAEQFGLVGMVAILAGFLSLFKDLGLSMATVQREVITNEQISTLFWINTALGVALAALSAAMAPVLVAFYHEPRLFWITIVQSGAFIFTGASAQHQALLQREMRFFGLAVIDVSSVLISIIVGIGMGLAGYGCWALVGMTVSGPAANMVLLWVTSKWVPGLPCRRAGVRAMMRFGGLVTLNNIIVYVAYNAEKVLLGRFWGAEVLGIYGRAYQLINLPTSLLNSSVGRVAFPMFSRVQNEPERLRAYFLKLYGVVLSFSIPVTLTCVLFAGDLIYVMLGKNWSSATPIFQWLAPTVLALALINPLGWTLTSTGKIARSTYMAMVIAPLVIVAYCIGLTGGPTRVAICYSSMMVLLIVPMTLWAVRGTSISGRDLARVVSRPLASSLAAALAGWAFKQLCGHWLLPLPRLVAGVAVVVAVYAWILLGVFGQMEFYRDIFKTLFFSGNERKGVSE